MNLMRRIGILAGMIAALGCAVYGQLANATNIYILPMSGALDQYLAQHLTEEGVLQVVTDASKADVILTPAIGADFERALEDLFDPEGDVTQLGDEFARPSTRPISSNRGTVFLVERSTGNVIWSDYEQPDSSSSDDLNDAARHLVDHLKDALEDARED